MAAVTAQPVQATTSPNRQPVVAVANNSLPPAIALGTPMHATSSPTSPGPPKTTFAVPVQPATAGQASTATGPSAAAAQAQRNRALSSASTTSLSTTGSALSNYTPNSQVSPKRIAEWKKHFDVAQGEELIYTYGCALVIDIMMHGRIFISTQSIGFKSNILGIKTYRHFPISDITSVRPKMVAGVIPNAIEVIHGDDNVKSLYTGVPSRDTTLSTILSLWASHSAKSYDSFIATITANKATDSEADLILKLSGEPVPLDESEHRIDEQNEDDSDSDDDDANGTVVGSSKRAPASTTKQTATTADTPDLEKEAIDTKLPTTPEQLYKLIYHNEAFLKGIWEGEGFRDIQIGAWQAKKRSSQYIKPIGGSIGSCTCKSTEEILHDDKDTWFEVLGVTQTPDVPSGKSFSTKSKTVFTHAAGSGTRMHVTYQVEWTGRSMLKGMINGQAESGQISWNKLLATKAREYIQAHPDEFLSDDGKKIEPDASEDAVEQSTTTKTRVNPDGTASQSQTTTTTSTEANSNPSLISAVLDWATEDPVRTGLAVMLFILFLAHLKLRFASPKVIKEICEPCLITVKEGRQNLVKSRAREL